MTTSVLAGFVTDARRQIRDALKVVPSAVVILILWFVALRYVFARWVLLSSLSAVERQSLALILAAPLALVTYFLGGYWDDRVFDARYGDDPRRRFRGKWLDTTKRNWGGLFPAGSDLDRARAKAAATLKLPSVEGVYSEAKRTLQASKQYTSASRLLYLSKLCRSLIWPCFLLAAGLIANVLYVLVTNQRLDTQSALGALATLLMGLLLVVPYVNLRVEHMLELYSRVGARKS